VTPLTTITFHSVALAQPANNLCENAQVLTTPRRDHRHLDRRDRLIARTLSVIEYHQANIAAAKVSHAKQRKRRLRAAGVALGHCKRCE